MKKIGLFLGSFDPITVAHINIASCVLNANLCDKVLFVVAKHNPWKTHDPASFIVRCGMIASSIEVFDGKCEVCTIENEIEPPTYSYKVLDKLREKYPEDELILICGTDTIDLVPEWRNFNTHIKDKFGFIEVKRNDGTEFENDKTPFTIREGVRNGLTNKGFWYIKTHRLDVSSTLVRNMIKNGLNPYPYVNQETLQFIKKYNLYS